MLGVTEWAGVTDVRRTVVRLFSPEGTLIFHLDDPGVKVTITGEGIVDHQPGWRAFRGNST